MRPAARPRFGVWLVAGAALLALASFPLVVERGSWLNTAVLVLLYAGLAQAWNILGGFAGQVSLGNAAFFGLGAYTSTVLLDRWNVSPWLGMPVGAVLAALFAVAVFYPVFRLGGHYFAIATIALAEIVLILFTNWEFVRGARGITIPFVRGPDRRPTDSWAFLQFNESRVPYYYVVLGLAVLAVAVAVAVDRSKLGYYLRAIKNDQQAAQSLGVPVLRYKLIAVAISAAVTAAFGTFFAQYLLFIDPETTMRLELSVLIALVAILGGVGTVVGPLLGALVLIPLSEVTRAQLGGSGNTLDLVLYGALIVLISVFQPNGLVALGDRVRRRREAGPLAGDEAERGEAPLVGAPGASD
jgi:branched-chain amino acid transport system permease protein